VELGRCKKDPKSPSSSSRDNTRFQDRGRKLLEMLGQRLKNANAAIWFRD